MSAVTMAPLSPWEAAAKLFEPPVRPPRRWASPLDMACDLDRTMVRTPALELINRTLVDLHDNRISQTRMAAHVSPQEGKSTLCSYWHPLWLLVDNPELRIIIISYSDEIARRWGSEIKRAVNTFDGDEGTVDLGLRLREDSRAAGRWQIEGHRGGVYCSGIGGQITGRPADCLPTGTPILTQYGYAPIEQLCDPGRIAPRVLSFNHGTGKAEWRRIIASRSIADRPLVEVVTSGGRRVRCTPDHRFYSPGRGYVAAADLCSGDALVVADAGDDLLPGLRPGVLEAEVDDLAGEAGDAAVLLAGVPVRGSAPDADLRGLRRELHETPVRGGEGEARGRKPALLLEVVLREGVRGRPRSAAEVHQVRRPNTTEAQGVFAWLSPTATGCDGVSGLQSLRDSGADAQLRAGEEAQAGSERLLLPDLRRRRICGEDPVEVRALRDAAHSSQGAPVLQSRMPHGRWRHGPDLAGQGLPAVRGNLPSALVTDHLLHSRLRERGALDSHGRCRELEVQGRHQLRGVVPADAAADLGAGPGCMRGVLGAEPDHGGHAHEGYARAEASGAVEPRCASHQREAVGKPAGEPDPAVHPMPHDAPQVAADTVLVVRDLRGRRDTVYDLQVEGNSNFFAGEVLVHNCIIVDDPLKNLEEAQSAKYRDRGMRTWQGTLVPRMAPDTKVVWVQTLWHEAEPIRQILDTEGADWKVVSIPAIADSPDDPLGRQIGEPMQSARGERDWARIRRDVGEYVFAALYQQRPAPAEGGLFKRLWWRTWTPAPPAGLGERIDCAGRIWPLQDCWRFITGDLAASTRTSADWTVAAAWALTLDGDLILLDRIRARVGEANHFDVFRPLAERWRVDTAFIEKSFHSSTLAIDATRGGLHITPIDAESDKFSRALPYSARVSAGRVWLPAAAPWLEEWVGEHAAFPNGSHDDQVDCGAYATRVAVTKWSPVAPQTLRPATDEVDFQNVPL